MGESSEKALASGAPPAASHKAVGGLYFERYAKPIVAGNRLFVLAVLEGLAILFLGIALIELIPLKQTVPYLERVAPSGNVTPIKINVNAPFDPPHNAIQFFLARFAKELLERNGALTRDHLIDAYSFTADNAATEFVNYLKQSKPIAEVKAHPNQHRTAAIESVSFAHDTIVLMRVTTHTLDTIAKVDKHTQWLLTLNYAIRPPTTEAAILKNPIGLYITDFTLEAQP
jgi:type IV secretory pathway component VirB8